jgi:hypothetical protein
VFIWEILENITQGSDVAPWPLVDVTCGVEIHGVIIKIYVMSDIHGIKRYTCDKKYY